MEKEKRRWWVLHCLRADFEKFHPCRQCEPCCLTDCHLSPSSARGYFGDRIAACSSGWHTKGFPVAFPTSFPKLEIFSCISWEGSTDSVVSPQWYHCLKIVLQLIYFSNEHSANDRTCLHMGFPLRRLCCKAKQTFWIILGVFRKLKGEGGASCAE